VRALHQGLSRLAEQIANTTNDSGARLAALTGQVETLAAGTQGAREDTQRLSEALEERFAALDERAAHADERLKEVEARIAHPHKDDGLAELEHRIAIDEEHIGHSLEKLGERLDAIEHRGIEAGVQDALRSLTARIASVEKKHHEAMADLESHLDGTARRIDSLEGALKAAPHEDTAPADPEPVDDIPSYAALGEAEPELPPFPDAITAAPSIDEPVLDSAESASTGEDYIAQARRAARAAAEPNFERHARRAQTGEDTTPATGAGGGRPKLRLVGIAALVLVLATAGALVARNSFSRLSTLSPARTIALDAPKAAAVSLKAGPQEPAIIVAAAPASAVATAEPSDGMPVADLLGQARAGSATAALLLGEKFADGKGIPQKDKEAARWLKVAAEAGEPVAQYRLGTLYERGNGVPEDAAQAMHWYGEAAMRGNRRAMHNLAVGYADGNGVAKDLGEAARWFKAAAQLGLTDSEFNLAVLYERGLGVPASLTEAYRWYAIAAAAGDAESKTRAAALAGRLAAPDREAAETLARAYKPGTVDMAANGG